MPFRYVLHGSAEGPNEIAEVVAYHFRSAVREFRRNPGLPPLYSFARYERDVPGEPEEWFGPEALVRQGGRTDCNDLAIYRAAELVVREGEAARPVLAEMEPNKWHVVVQREDGRIEDPSARLGMLGGGYVGNFRVVRRGDILVAGVAVGDILRVYRIRHHLPDEVGAFGDRLKEWWNAKMRRDAGVETAKLAVREARTVAPEDAVPLLRLARVAARAAVEAEDEMMELAEGEANG